MKKNSKKVVVLGEGRVGKTSLSLRFTKNTFNEQQESTINASYLEKTVSISDTESVNLTIWDTAGQEKFKSITPMYYQSAVCAIIVYDITFRESFEQVKNWVSELQNALDISKVVICIAGNKCDLEIKRQIEKKEAEDYAKSVGAAHFLTSAKNNKGIDEMFQYLSKEISSQKEQKKTTRMIISADTKKKKKTDSGSCC